MLGFQKFFKTFMALVLIIPMTATHGFAQNLRVQSGIVAATSGLVRVVREDIGKIAETGQQIYLNDIVETGDGGKMQIMLMDRTTVTIGPNTSLIIDEFVYDPGVERTLSATVLKGTFKLASPSLFNKGKESRELKLPNAVVAIRGTELLGSIGADTQDVVLLNGAITVANNDFAQDIDRPNFGVSISDTGEISSPEFFSSEDLGVLLNQLEGEPVSENAPEETGSTEEDAAGEEQDDTQDGETTTAAAEDDTSTDEGAASVEPVAEPSDQSQPEAPVFSAARADGPPPTEAEVVAAAEAVANGSADINDFSVLSRAGPENIQAVAGALGVPFDEETGDISPEAGAAFAPTINAFVSQNGLARTEAGEGGFEAPELSFNFQSEEGLDAPQFTFNFDRESSGFSVSENFAPEPIEGGGFNFEIAEPQGFDVQFSTREFQAPVIEFNPVAFETLAEFTTFETDTDFFFEPTSFFIEPVRLGFGFERNQETEAGFNEEFEAVEQEFESFDEEISISLDNLVTEALEEVILENALDTSSILQPGTYMPDRSSYRSWNGSEWSTIADNFNNGVVRFEHNNAVASFHSGSSCQNCEAVISNVVTINFNSMEYQFDGNGVFSKPGYNDVEFSATTPNIPLNYWELSTGTISRLPNERELESTYDNADVYTLTSSSDPSSTISATIDLDFLYDTQLSDNNDLNSNIGVYGYSEIEYTETGGSEVTFRTATEAMQPVQE